MKKFGRTTVCLIVFFLMTQMLCSCAADAVDSAREAAKTAAEADSASDADKSAADEAALADTGSSAKDSDSAAVQPSKPFTPAGIPEASGTATEENDSAVIDYSNVENGYVMVDFSEDRGNPLKVQVEGPATTYTYDLKVGSWTTFPLSDGDGNYKVTVYEGMGNNKYSTVLSSSFPVALESEFAPFLHANQYVDYTNAADTMAKTAELTGGTADTLEKVGNIYDFVIKHVTYDTQKAASVQSGYLPVLDDVLASKKGICFDYAALTAGMLRSCGIPCKLVVGYSGETYHAWISVWTEESGWINDVIRFDGKSWQRMDPTFASANNSSEAVMQYIGDGGNYMPEFQY